MAIDFGGSAVRVSLRHEVGDQLVGTIPANVFSDPDGAPSATDVLAGTGELLEAAAALGPVECAAVALPGTVDPASGGILGINGKYDRLLGRDVVGWVADRLGLPRERVALENDARAALVGELHEGAAQGFGDAVLVILGTGVGTAVAQGGVLLTGRFGHAGVLGGHLVVDVEGPRCTCGGRGCAEAILGSWALPGTWQRVARTQAPPGLGYRELLDLATGGDPAARAVWEHLQSTLGALLVTLCHAHDPEVVVLSGGPLHHSAFDLPTLTEHLHGALFPSSHRPELRIATDPGLSVVKGLHHLARERQEL
ncbi:ROK family protein [Aestuariimicrobium ganziense]|uniref:ROK family protein n=1 Tax=Aestuariimicrobium ganziense TaxID=2773677 RepID=UPI001941EE2F|nr:ROK family protein [Aestuariimicrobium ganziense]